MATRDYQAELDRLIDGVLDLLELSARDGVEIDPLATILDRLRVRGDTIDLDAAPPMLRMLLSGLGS